MNLQDVDFVCDTKNGRIIKDKKQLLDLWVSNYNEVLKPKLLVGTMAFRQKRIEMSGKKHLASSCGVSSNPTASPLAVTFCRVLVMPQPCGGFFGKVGFFRRAALAAVKQTVLARVVLRLCGSSHHIQNGIGKKFSHKLSPSLKV